MAEMSEEYDKTLVQIWRTNYITVFETKDIGWQELVAVASLLALLSVYCAPFLGIQEKLTTVAFQTSFILLLIIVLSLVTAMARILFQIDSIQPRMVFMLLAGHYTVTLVSVLTAVFIWGDAFPFYNDIESLSWVYPALATVFFVLMTFSDFMSLKKSDDDGRVSGFVKNPRFRDMAAAISVFVIVNYCNYKIFSDFVDSGSTQSIFYQVIQSASGTLSGN